MSILDTIKKRRSTKKFLKTKVDFKEIAQIIEAGMWAPTAGNVQPWKFILVQDKSKMQEVEKAAFHQEWMSSSAFMIVVCAQVAKTQRFYGVRGERLYAVQDCAAAIENMLLEATSLDIGSCWVGAFDEVEIKRALDIPDEVRPQAIIAFGHPDGDSPVPGKKEIGSALYFEKYGERELKGKELFPLGDHVDSAKKSVKERLENIKDKLFLKK
jgi:nitroreductase